MPTGLDHHSASLVKLLCVGESGTGKSGMLASLLISGYTLHILDYDNGVDIIINILRNHYKDDGDALKDALSRLHFETLRDTVYFVNGVPKIKSPVHAYKDAGKTLMAWDVESFDDNDVIVLDTLTTFTDAGFNEALSSAGRLNQRPQLQDYGWMADSVKLFIEMLTSSDLKCHVIVNTHIRYFAGSEDDQTTSRGLPNAKGQEISRVIARYFNSVILTRSIGAGPATKRVITTQPQGVVEVKTSSPSTVKATYPIDTGLADLFVALLGHGPTQKKLPTST